MRKQLFAAAALALTMTACGGGGGGSPAPAPAPAPTPAVPTPEGIYVGTTSTNYELQLLALDGGALWGLYGNTVNNVFLVRGMVQANGTYNNGSFAATDGRDYGSSGSPVSGTVSASYTAAGAFSGTVTATTGALTFTTTKGTALAYDYNATPSVAALAGTYSGATLDGAPSVVSLQATGAFTGNSGGCSFGGNFAPRASGKNVYNVTLTFAQSSACLLPGVTVTGIALGYQVSGRTQLIAAVQNSGRTLGTAFVGLR